MSDEFHKPFLKNLVFVAFVTIFAMVSSHYVIKYYMSSNDRDGWETIYTIKELKIESK
jgi:hypothetical protein